MASCLSMENSTNGFSLVVKGSRDSISHWHCPPQTEATIISFFKIQDESEEEKPSTILQCDTPLVRILNPDPPPYQVISNRRHVVSAPLSHFTYNHREKAFTHRDTFTWTPMYLHYCKQLVTEQQQQSKQFFKTNETIPKVRSRKLKQDVGIRLFSLLSRKVASKSAAFWTQGKLGGAVANHQPCRPVHHSKLMESPYMRKNV